MTENNQILIDMIRKLMAGFEITINEIFDTENNKYELHIVERRLN